MNPDKGRGAHRVVIVGCGFGGLFAARFLRRAPVEVTMVDRTNHHLFQPLLYQVATGVLSSGQIAPATRDVLRKHRHLKVELAEVQGFDLAARTVLAERPDGGRLVLPYDSLIVAAGAGQSYFGHPEFARWAPGMKTLQDAHEHRARIFGAFEMAELEQDDETRRAWLTFVVVGGGPTGVEVAGQIAELSRRSLGRNFRRFDPADARVILFDGARDILTAFGDHLASRGAHELRRTGVEVVTETIVTGVDAYGVEVRGPGGEVRRIEARTKIWAAGVEASPLARMLAEACGAEVDPAGRIAVAPDCTIPGHPEVFAIGDMMTLDDLPGVAEVAMQQGAYAARTIRRRLGGDDRPGKAFRYRDLGSMATVSRFRAVASFHGVRLAGFLGWLAWLFVHLVFLTGFKNRFITVLYWFFSFLGRSRVERALDLDQIAAAERTDT